MGWATKENRAKELRRKRLTVAVLRDISALILFFMAGFIVLTALHAAGKI